MFLSNLSIKQPVLATMMMLALAVLGIASYRPFTTITLGSGTSSTQVGAKSFTLSNQKLVRRESTSPLKGMVPST